MSFDKLKVKLIRRETFLGCISVTKVKLRIFLFRQKGRLFYALIFSMFVFLWKILESNKNILLAILFDL